MKINIQKHTYLFLVILMACQSNSKNREARETENQQITPTITESADKVEVKEDEDLPEALEDTGLSDYFFEGFADTIQVNEINDKAIVVISILPEQIDILKSKYGEEDFYTIADDNMYYTYLFDTALDSLQLPVVGIKSRFLKFNLKDTSLVLDLQKGKNGGLVWSYILFNTIDPPKLVEDILIPDFDEIIQYLNKEAGLTIFEESAVWWNFPKREISRLVNEVKDSTMADLDFKLFLNDYVSTIDKLNNILYDHEDYESFNSIIWADETLHEQKAIEFEEQVFEKGFRVASSEGMIFIERNTDFLDQMLSKYFTQQMVAFHKMYSNENNNPFADDGGIILSLNQVVDRAIYWEKFKANYPEFEIMDYVEDRINNYTYFLMVGMDNTPAFGFTQNKELDAVFMRAYDYSIKNYPDSELSKLLAAYLILIKESDFKETQSVTDFAKKYQPW